MLRKKIIFVILLTVLVFILWQTEFFDLTGYSVKQGSDFGSGSGNAILESYETGDGKIYSNSRTCSDSDGGIFYQKQGSVNYAQGKNTLNLVDRCSSEGRQLWEYYCSRGRVATAKTTCLLGCADGKCINENDDEKCYWEIEINESAKEISPAAMKCTNPIPSRAGKNTINIKSSASSNSEQAQQALDFSLSTAWVGQREYPQYLSFDFGAAYCVAQLNLYIPGGGTQAARMNYDIEVSDNGITWKTIVQDVSSSHFISAHNEYKDFPESVTVRYVRLKFTSATYYPIIGEVSFNPGREETKPAEYENVTFSLLNANSIHGNYGHLVRPYYAEDGAIFILETFTNNRGVSKSLKQYALQSSRFVIAEDFSDEKKGEIIEFKEGIISSYVPYDARIRYLRINDSEKLHWFILPKEALQCKRTCKAEGESGKRGEAECCKGLDTIQYKNETTMFVCVKCGDGICSADERHLTCSEDCKD